MNATVSWALSGGDSSDFYLINITTNAPQTPYGGLLNITTASVTHELTGFMAGYEYNITVCGVNCRKLEGGKSEPLSITPKGMWVQRKQIPLHLLLVLHIKVESPDLRQKCIQQTNSDIQIRAGLIEQAPHVYVTV